MFIRWGRRPVPANAPQDKLAWEIGRIKVNALFRCRQGGSSMLPIMRQRADKGGMKRCPGLDSQAQTQRKAFLRVSQSQAPKRFIGSVVSNMLRQR